CHSTETPFFKNLTSFKMINKEPFNKVKLYQWGAYCQLTGDKSLYYRSPRADSRRILLFCIESCLQHIQIGKHHIKIRLIIYFRNLINTKKIYTLIFIPSACPFD